MGTRSRGAPIGVVDGPYGPTGARPTAWHHSTFTPGIETLQARPQSGKEMSVFADQHSTVALR